MIRFIIFIFCFLFYTASTFAYSGGISTFGDLKYSANFNHFDYVNPNAPKGCEMKYGEEGTFNSLNPFIIKGLSASGSEMLFDSLMEGSADEISARYGLIASEAILAKDKTYIIFKLRKNAKWHDGSKISADDVIFSFNTLIEKGHPAYKMIYRDVKEARKINDYEVKFIFKNNKNRDLPVDLAGLPIFSKNYYQKIDFDKSTLIPPLGSGPYKVKSIDPGRSITYERVKDYWAKDLPVNKGRYNFDTIIYDYYRDNNVLVEAFKAGAYDIRQENIARNWANSYNIDKVKNGEIIKKEIIHGLPTGMQAFVFNLRREKFQNRKVREAISYAFDFEWARSKIFYNSYYRTTSYFSNSEFASNGPAKGEVAKILLPFKDKIPPEVFTNYYQPPKTDGSGYSRANLLKARQILKEQGYVIKNGKLIDPKTGQPLTIEFLIDGKAFQMIIAPMIKNLSKLGIDARSRLVEDNQYKVRIDNFDYDIMVNVYGQGLIPGNEQFAYWHSSQRNLSGSRNLAGTNDVVVDNLTEKIMQSTGKKELKNLTQALDLVLLWNYYAIPQWHNKTYRILYKNKFSMPDKSPPYSLAVDSWWCNGN
jgi:microcin C transport system substrate-binding protein